MAYQYSQTRIQSICMIKQRVLHAWRGIRKHHELQWLNDMRRPGIEPGASISLATRYFTTKPTALAHVTPHTPHQPHKKPTAHSMPPSFNTHPIQHVYLWTLTIQFRFTSKRMRINGRFSEIALKSLNVIYPCSQTGIQSIYMTKQRVSHA